MADPDMHNYGYSPRQPFAGLSLASYHAMSAFQCAQDHSIPSPTIIGKRMVLLSEIARQVWSVRVTMLNLAFYRTDITALMLMCSVYPTFSYDGL